MSDKDECARLLRQIRNDLGEALRLTEQSLTHISDPQNYAIVFSGGGALGAWEVGCYKAILDRRNHEPSIVTGASSGALNAAGICARMSPDDLEKLWTGAIPKEIYRERPLTSALCALIQTMLKKPRANPLLALASKFNSVYLTSPLERKVSSIFDKNRFKEFKKSDIACAFSLTDLTTGQPSFFYKPASANIKPCPNNWTQITDQSLFVQGLMGTTAIPILFPPSKYKNKDPLFDGGVLMNQPIAPAIDLGARMIYVLIPQREALMDTTNLLSIAESLVLTWMRISLYSQIQAITTYNKITNYFHDRQPVRLCVIRPKHGLGTCYGVSLLSFGHRVKDLVDDGENAAKDALDTCRKLTPRPSVFLS